MQQVHKITCIGHFGFNVDLSNGQTVKTKIVTNEIEKAFGAENVQKVDTHGGVKAIPSLLKNIWNSVRRSQDVVVFLSDNGLRVIVPVLWLMSRLLGHKRFHYVVIGGYIQDYLPSHRLVKNVLKRYEGIYVETKPMCDAMNNLGFDNVLVMPNCKSLQLVEKPKLYENAPFSFCTFSRVMKSKGIEDAVYAVEKVNEKGDICRLDIYGQIDENEKDWFNELLKTVPPYIQYKGIVPFNESTSVLSNYYALLFPTYYEGEGFAGTLIDAFAAGLPVIASDWKYNASIVEEGKTGVIYKTHSEEELTNAIREACEKTQEWNKMKVACVEEAKRYQPDIVVEPLIKALRHGN